MPGKGAGPRPGLPCPSPYPTPSKLFPFPSCAVSHPRALACVSPFPWELLTYLEKSDSSLRSQKKCHFLGGPTLVPLIRPPLLFLPWHPACVPLPLRDPSILPLLGTVVSSQAGSVGRSEGCRLVRPADPSAEEAQWTCTPSSQASMRQIHMKHITQPALEIQQRMKEMTIPAFTDYLILGQGRLRLEQGGGRSEGDVLWAEE